MNLNAQHPSPRFNRFISFVERQPTGLVEDLEEVWKAGGRRCFCWLMAAWESYLLRKDHTEAGEVEFLLSLHWVRTVEEIRRGGQ